MYLNYFIILIILDNSIGFASVYMVDSYLFGGQRYPPFENRGQVAFSPQEF